MLWAKQSLEQLRRRLWHETGATRAEPLTVEMTHFVVTLHSFVSDRIMHGAWAQLEKVQGPGGPVLDQALLHWLRCVIVICSLVGP